MYFSFIHSFIYWRMDEFVRRFLSSSSSHQFSSKWEVRYAVLKQTQKYLASFSSGCGFCHWIHSIAVSQFLCLSLYVHDCLSICWVYVELFILFFLLNARNIQCWHHSIIMNTVELCATSFMCWNVRIVVSGLHNGGSHLKISIKLNIFASIWINNHDPFGLHWYIVDAIIYWSPCGSVSQCIRISATDE